MDPNANTGPVNPEPPHSKSKPHDIAEAGPIDPATGQPDHGAEVSALKSWFRENFISLIITAIVVALVLIYLDPIGTILMVVGLGLVIFIHELGHFLAAKWCDVHVKTFSIGFGPAVPFCSYKWGETTYMVGIIPLGGYVAMVGESEGGDGEEEGEEDPRSFRKKSVGQRMLIISAGVIMNVILGMACFVAAYLNGVQEIPATVGRIESGGAAWRAGLRTDDKITRIGSSENPSFKDIPPKVMTTLKGEQLPIEVRRDGQTVSGLRVEPLRDEGQLFPQIGVGSAHRLTLMSIPKRKNFKPVIPGSKAAEAGGFEPGDRIVAMSSDPKDPTKVTPLRLDDRGLPDFRDYHERMVLLAGKPITFGVLRKGQPDDAETTKITVQPAYRHDLGMRMRMGEVVALRRDGPAEKAGVQARAEGQTRGDRIVEVAITEADGTETRYAVGDKAKPLDPLLLPHQLEKWAFSVPPSHNRKVKLIVLREVEHTEKKIPITLDYDTSYRFERESQLLPNTPLSITALGLAYWVEAVVDEVTPGGPAATAGVQRDDVITAVRFKALDDTGTVKTGDWKDELKSQQWASAAAGFQASPPYEIDIKVKRNVEGREETIEFTLKGKENSQWPVEDRGLAFEPDTRVHRAADVGEAMNLGARRTVRFIRDVYMNLYGMIRGRISPKTMSGPITIAAVSYRLAEEDLWKLILFLGLISVNLAVVNFLPIPVLDGGHMVFLILEKILGRPVPEKLFAFAMYTGLFLILSLFVYVIFLDVNRQFFGWF